MFWLRKASKSLRHNQLPSMGWRRSLGTAYIKYKIRVSRGNSFTSEINGILSAFQHGGIILLLISTYFHVLVPLFVLPVVWVTQKIVEYLIGYYDEKYMKLWAFETKYQQQNKDINPFQFELMQRLRRIEKKLNNLESSKKI